MNNNDGLEAGVLPENVEVDLLASDSMGVRSMAVMVKTPDISMVIDPGAALGQRRFSLSPARIEERELQRYTAVIEEKAREADALTISHYHYDHHIPESHMFNGKKLFLKDISEKINKSQRERGEFFLSTTENNSDITFCDGTTVDIGGTTLSFSHPVPHGPEGTRLGYVVMTAISRGKDVILHTSDIEGILDSQALQWLTDLSPTLVVADGPPLYLLGYRFSNSSFQDSIKTMHSILNKTDCRLVIDHHLLRSVNYREKMNEIFSSSRVDTFASYNSKQENLLEARRKELHTSERRNNNGA